MDGVRCWGWSLGPCPPSLCLESASGTMWRGNKLGKGPPLPWAKAGSNSGASERMEELLGSERQPGAQAQTSHHCSVGKRTRD